MPFGGVEQGYLVGQAAKLLPQNLVLPAVFLADKPQLPLVALELPFLEFPLCSRTRLERAEVVCQIFSFLLEPCVLSVVVGLAFLGPGVLTHQLLVLLLQALVLVNQGVRQSHRCVVLFQDSV